MSIVVSDARVILVNYQCDICKNGLLYCIDKECTKDDEGDYHSIYTHRCPNCGFTIDIEDISYPYPKIIPISNIRQPKQEELL